MKAVVEEVARICSLAVGCTELHLVSMSQARCLATSSECETNSACTINVNMCESIQQKAGESDGSYVDYHKRKDSGAEAAAADAELFSGNGHADLSAAVDSELTTVVPPAATLTMRTRSQKKSKRAESQISTTIIPEASHDLAPDFDSDGLEIQNKNGYMKGKC